MVEDAPYEDEPPLLIGAKVQCVQEPCDPREAYVCVSDLEKRKGGACHETRLERMQERVSKPGTLLVISCNDVGSIAPRSWGEEHFKFHPRACNLAMTISQLQSSSLVYMDLRFWISCCCFS